MKTEKISEIKKQQKFIFIENIKKIDKPLARLIKKEDTNHQYLSETRAITTELA